MKRKLGRKWRIHLIHHTHLDIGYTHTQDEVLDLQIKHLKNAMSIIESNSDNQDGSAFKWNPEITWALIEWLKIAPEAEKNQFIKLVKDRRIGLDGLFGNLLTGLCRPEEMMESFFNKKELEKLTDTTIDSAMITDVPGWNWGFVTALRENGIKYLSIGTNLSDRIGHILRDWKDQPFYWQSPSGEKVLAFVHGKGYSWFHTGMKNTKNLSRKLNPARVSKYLKQLEDNGYPYDTVILRYNIGQDNGPPDTNLSDIVEKWNMEHPEMNINISTTSEAMTDFEDKHKELIPTLKGDLTPYWEDGAASTARETAIARRAGEKLNQVSALAHMTGSNIQLNDTWKSILLFNEHTWGAYNSISKPDHHFAESQWAWKSQHAHKAMDQISDHVNSIFSNFETKTDQITVYNTHSWSIDQVVTIETDHNAVYTSNNEAVLSQKLHNGQLAFVVKDLKGFSSEVYTLKSCQNQQKPKTVFKTTILLDKNGLIESIKYQGKEFVKQSNSEKFNHFIFAKGKWGNNRVQHLNQEAKVTTIDDGSLIKTFKVDYTGFRDTKVTTTLSINTLNERIYLENSLDRSQSRKKEGLHFEFPFDLPDGRIKYDVIYGSSTINSEQLKGANKNFVTATRWFDVSNDFNGMSCCLLDAPIFKPGEIVHDPIRSGPPELCGWLREAKYTGNVYSYVMNNYWMTNYKADQPGMTSFKYVFLPHKEYNETQTHKFSIEESQPLIVGFHDNKIKPLLNIESDSIICSHLKTVDKYTFIRLWNTSKQSQSIVLPSSNFKVNSPNKEHLLKDNVMTLKPSETIELFSDDV